MSVGASQMIPLSVLAQKPYKGLALEISHETERGRGKKGPRDSRQERAVKKRSVKRSGQTDQSREQTSRQKSGEADGRERPVKIPG